MKKTSRAKFFSISFFIKGLLVLFLFFLFACKPKTDGLSEDETQQSEQKPPSVTQGGGSNGAQGNQLCRTQEKLGPFDGEHKLIGRSVSLKLKDDLIAKIPFIDPWRSFKVLLDLTIVNSKIRQYHFDVSSDSPYITFDQGNYYISGGISKRFDSLQGAQRDHLDAKITGQGAISTLQDFPPFFIYEMVLDSTQPSLNAQYNIRGGIRGDSNYGVIGTNQYIPGAYSQITGDFVFLLEEITLNTQALNDTYYLAMVDKDKPTETPAKFKMEVKYSKIISVSTLLQTGQNTKNVISNSCFDDKGNFFFVTPRVVPQGGFYRYEGKIARKTKTQQSGLFTVGKVYKVQDVGTEPASESHSLIFKTTSAF